MKQQLLELVRHDPKAPLLFTGGQFLFWFTLFYLAYLWLRQSGRARLLLVAAFSCFFYYKSSGALLLALLFTAAVDYAIARRIADSSSPVARRRWLVLSIATSSSLLLYFKYTNFVIGGLAHAAGLPFRPLDLVAPAGISFYTFESISYVVDVYRRRLAPARSFALYLSYLAYFPHLMAGPIMRAEALLPSLQRPRPSPQRLGSGLFWVLLGLLQKTVIADYLSSYVDDVFAGGAGLSGFELLLGVYAYAAQIFCDFAGYSAMALGLGRLTGVDLPINFLAPYSASSITDFWRRWHVTLSGWLRDYVYVPLGGNRHGTVRMALCLMATMLLGGLWHGASWSFVAWGAAHGALLCFEKLVLRRIGARVPPPSVPGFWGSICRSRALRCFLTFQLVAALWVPFRMPELGQCAQLFARIGGDFQVAHVTAVLHERGRLLFLLALGVLLGVLPVERIETAALKFGSSPWWLRGAVALGAVELCLELRGAAEQPFIYFQF